MLRWCCKSLVADSVMTYFFIKKPGIGILLGDGGQKNTAPRIGRALGGGDHKILGRALEEHLEVETAKV
ncbi:hypothetical protein AMTR_s00042p00198150 [Amborella trichopoda]|uniref:Uncharacterized protein n=1 Tax=Amborella trichopoda TaxID=13333 RepID=W1P6P9_AMBTC|nr:hypothetical protein AMTR_s00042p00198150 [Amborella trichopoda]